MYLPLLVSASATLAAAQIPTPAIKWTPVSYTSLAGDTLAADSARVIVPENRARLGGSTIAIQLLRVRSTAAKPGAPIIYLAGGPGAGAILGMRGDIFPTVAALSAVSDVILFDQRGTGFTLPSLVVRGSLGVPLDKPLLSTEAHATAIARARAAAAEVRARGIDLAAYNTVESADDIDDIRQALGAGRVIVWGHSYGSHLGLAYIQRHGDRVERAILGGINGLDQRRRMPRDADAMLARLDSVIGATPKLRAAMPDLPAALRRVLEKLARQPVLVRVDSQDVLVGKEEVQTVIAIQSGDQSFVRALPLTIAQMDAGDFAWMARQVRDVIKARPMGTAMTYVMDMASGVSADRARRIREQVPSAILGNAINFLFDDPAFRAAWAPADLGDSFRAPLTSSVPVLFISGTLDGRTSLADAEEVRRGFTNGSHLIVDGSSHNPYALTTDLRDAMVRFARGERVSDAHLRAPNVELRGPGEPELIAELRVLANGAGAEAAARRLREVAAPGSSRYVSSFVPGDLALALLRQDKKPSEAAAVLEAGVELFPRSSFLWSRLAEVQSARGDTAAAAASYRRAVAADPFNQVAVVQLRRLVMQNK